MGTDQHPLGPPRPSSLLSSGALGPFSLWKGLELTFSAALWGSGFCNRPHPSLLAQHIQPPQGVGCFNFRGPQASWTTPTPPLRSHLRALLFQHSPCLVSSPCPQGLFRALEWRYWLVVCHTRQLSPTLNSASLQRPRESTAGHVVDRHGSSCA